VKILIPKAIQVALAIFQTMKNDNKKPEGKLWRFVVNQSLSTLSVSSFVLQNQEPNRMTQ
jgi:hypothetical protein